MSAEGEHTPNKSLKLLTSPFPCSHPTGDGRGVETKAPHRWVLAAMDWAMALLSMSRSRALEAQPTTAGGRLLEKR